jgi:hypothetical protein
MELPQEPEEPEEPRLGWEERPARRLVQLALPITLSGLSFAVMGLIDTVFVAKLGPAVLAGVGLGVVITNGVMGFGFGVLRGLKTLLAQARGTGAHDASGKYVGAGLLLGLWLGLLAAALGELCAWLVPYVAESEAAAQAAREYIAVRSLGAPIIVVYVALREARYGLGDTRSALVSSLIGNTAHVAFDYVALFVFGLGAAGAALGSVFAFSVQMALLAFAQRAEPEAHHAVGDHHAEADASEHGRTELGHEDRVDEPHHREAQSAQRDGQCELDQPTRGALFPPQALFRLLGLLRQVHEHSSRQHDARPGRAQGAPQPNRLRDGHAKDGAKTKTAGTLWVPAASGLRKVGLVC